MNRVREARLKSHMSQDELADKSGLARPTISKIERVETEPSGLSKQKIADALDIAVHEIFPDEKTQLQTMALQQDTSNIMGIAVVNGAMAAGGVRGRSSGDVAVQEPRIEGFLIDKTGDKCNNQLVHLIHNGEKIDSTVTGREGRFVFKELEKGDYVILADDKYQAVTVSLDDDSFEFEI